MPPAVAVTYRAPGFSAQALKDRERRVAVSVLQQLIRHAGLLGSRRGAGRLGQRLACQRHSA